MNPGRLAGRLGLGLAVAACGAWGSCSRSGTTSAAEVKTTVAPEAPRQADPDCTGGLPKVTEANFDGGAAAAVAAAARGGIAVVWDGKRARLVEGCRLEGTYEVIPGQDGTGVFRVTNRAMFLTDEITGPCLRGTHVLAAFATGDHAPPSRHSQGAARLGGVLVPLPCPPVTDPEPARGCIGKGLTGKERLARAAPLIAAMSKEDQAAGRNAPRLDAFALAPDTYDSLQLVRLLLNEQGPWIVHQYGQTIRPDYSGYDVVLAPPGKRDPPPRYIWTQPGREMVHPPPFTDCFPDQVELHIGTHVIF